MSDRSRSIVTALGIIAIVFTLTVAGGFFLRPQLGDYENGSPPDLTRCQYADAKKATDEAQAAYDKLGEAASQALIEDTARKLQAAQQQESKAQSCEHTEHDSSDLAAQWASARAAENTVRLANQLYWWGVIEIGVVILALLAAGWAASETREANRISRENIEAQLRPYPAMTGGSKISIVTTPNEVTVALQFFALNAGQSPLFDVDFDYEVFFLQAASGGPSVKNRVIRRARNIAVLPQGSAPFEITERDIVISTTEAHAAIEATGSEQAIDNLAVHIRCTITGFTSDEAPIQRHAVWLRLRETIPAHALHLQPGQHRRFEYTFEPPSFDHGFGDANAREIPPVETLRTEKLLRDVDRIIAEA